MNWMKASLGRWRGNTLLLGAMAGSWGALLYHATLWATREMEPGLLPAGLAGLALGAGLCGGIAPVEEVANRFPRRALRAAFYGAGLGILVGAPAFALLELTFSSSAPIGTGGIAQTAYGPWLGVPVAMALLGGCAGLASGLAGGRRQKSFWRARVGAGCGFLAAIPFALLLALTPEFPWTMPLACAAWGAAVAFGIFWGERKLARRWLRVLTGPGEDNFYPLDTPWITLGKLESNDIPLPNYEEVFPFHCRLKWEGDHYQIADGEQGGTVLVNYRQIQEQALRPGDLVKLGSALLQYGEASK